MIGHTALHLPEWITHVLLPPVRCTLVSNLKRLQVTENALARAVCHSSRLPASATELRRQFHRLHLDFANVLTRPTSYSGHQLQNAVHWQP